MNMIQGLPSYESLGVNYNYGTPVITTAQQFVIPVPQLARGGEPLVHPGGRTSLTDGRGVGVRDRMFFDESERGIVFGQSRILVGSRLFEGGNYWFGARGDGSAAIAIKEVTEEKAGTLIEKLTEMGRPEDMTLKSLKVFLRFAETLGVGSMQSHDRSYVEKHMTPVKAGEKVVEVFGEVYGWLRDAAHSVFDLTVATYIDTPFELGGDAFEEGGVMVTGQYRSVMLMRPAEFIEAYRMQWDGARITDLARQVYRHGDDKRYDNNDYDPEAVRPETAWLIRIKDE